MVNPESKLLRDMLINQFSRDSVMPATYGTLANSRKLLNNKYMLKVLNNEELLTSAKLFLQYDLNISIASKKGFMHRNTLIYRLECIEKLTGLDLRHFEDAVIFHNIIKANEQKNNHISLWLFFLLTINSSITFNFGSSLCCVFV